MGIPWNSAVTDSWESKITCLIQRKVHPYHRSSIVFHPSSKKSSHSAQAKSPKEYIPLLHTTCLLSFLASPWKAITIMSTMSLKKHNILVHSNTLCRNPKAIDNPTMDDLSSLYCLRKLKINGFIRPPKFLTNINAKNLFIFLTMERLWILKELQPSL